jgi:HAE1 family hydrophobic/amphiphilic exporter-1
MDLADLSIRRPVFITCVIFLMLLVGWLSFKKLPVDLYPNVEFPIVTVTVVYPGAGPSEMETLVTKAVEEEISVIAGLKRVTSQSVEGTSQIMAEFDLGIDAQYAEQQIRDKVGAARPKLPAEALEPVIRRLDPSALPIMTLALQAEQGAGDARLYDIADQIVKPQMEKIAGVGLVDLVGGRKREVHVELDRQKLARREVSVLAVSSRVGESGENVPSGTVDRGSRQVAFRTVGQYQSLKDIENVVIDLFLNAEPTRIADVGTVTESLADERTRVFVNGKKGLFLNVYKQSGANTIAVADGVHQQMTKIDATLAGLAEKGKLNVVRDSSDFIRRDVADVKETILIGIILTVIVVYLFLANGRSTIITGLALPNSLIGAFVLMYLAGFSVNIVTLLALTLAIGLLIDDAIVVRENIFRHLEKGDDPMVAAYQGTAEVRLAVIATTLVVICVFAPVAFMGGIIGQFMRQFGLTICFAMAISLFDALTVAPMLSAYFAGDTCGLGSDHPWDNKKSFWGRTMGQVLFYFDRLQLSWEDKYERFIGGTLKRPGLTLALSVLVAVIAAATVYKVPRVFLPEPDSGEFMISMETPPGTNLGAMSQAASRVDEIVRDNKEVQITTLTVGGQFGESNEASIYVRLLPFAKRDVATSVVKDRIRGQLASVKEGAPTVKAFDPFGGGQDQPIMLNLVGDNQEQLQKYADLLIAKMQTDPRIRDVESSFKAGKPEFQIQPKQDMMQILGVNTRTIGNELHAQVQGVTPAKYREAGLEYDVRVRLKPDQRDLFASFHEILVPNVNFRLIKLDNVATPVQTRGPAVVTRQDRGRFIQIVADLTPGASQATVLDDIESTLKDDLKIPSNMSFVFVGASENFQDMGRQMSLAFTLGVLLIYLVLASLYESFITPLTIMLALPLALCGAFLALFLANEYMSLFSMLGIVMLLGVASKNSILLVDYARQLMDDENLSREAAVTKAGRTRLRPILMTSMALIAGTIPVALGLNEASKQRTSMGWAIIGGMVSSTLLSLVVIPVAFIYIDRFRVWTNEFMRQFMGTRRPTVTPAVGGTVTAPTRAPRRPPVKTPPPYRPDVHPN